MNHQIAPIYFFLQIPVLQNTAEVNCRSMKNAFIYRALNVDVSVPLPCYRDFWDQNKHENTENIQEAILTFDWPKAFIEMQIKSAK